MRTLQIIVPVIVMLLAGCSGSYVIEEENVQDGMVVGSESMTVDGEGEAVRKEGYMPTNPYQEDVLNDDNENLGPNAPGYIPPPPN